jgi:DNA mismatch endonuclease (patch repair protein)
MDKISPETRSHVMAAVRSKDTGPERAVRTLVFALGYRFRLHRKDLPGTPDLVFPGRKKVIFVNGCFWHFHNRCSAFREPKSRVEYWQEKLVKNRLRDRQNQKALRKLGWTLLVIWECEIKNLPRLRRRIVEFLDPRNPDNSKGEPKNSLHALKPVQQP